MNLECISCHYGFESFDVIANVNEFDYSELDFRCPKCGQVNYCSFKGIKGVKKN